jgi:hypothetical protein
MSNYIHDSHADLDFLQKARILIEDAFSKAAAKYNSINKIKSLVEKHIYNDRLQMKIALYRLHQDRLKDSQDERNNKLITEEKSKKHRMTEIKQASNSFINRCIENTLFSYQHYKDQAEPSVRKIQRTFRRSMWKLILKMEKMNRMLEYEEEQAKQRKKSKSNK